MLSKTLHTSEQGLRGGEIMLWFFSELGVIYGEVSSAGVLGHNLIVGEDAIKIVKMRKWKEKKRLEAKLQQ